MRKLYIDFETRSELNVKDAGAFKYTMHPSTEMLLVSWAVDDGEVRVDTEISDELLALLEAEDVLKIAHNAEFDMCVCKFVLGLPVDPVEWYDTAYQAAYCAYPRKLSHLADALRTTAKASQDEMLLFAEPRCVGRKAQSDDLFGTDYATVWNEKEDYPEEWERFVEYSRGDVIVMRECHKKMRQLPPIEVCAMRLTFEMNMNGVPFDMGLATRIKSIADDYAGKASERALAEYGIKNLRSVKQVQEALQREGVQLTTLNKKMRNGVEHPILELKDQATGASFSKVDKAAERICPDGRLHGEFVGYGAHTGRWSSRGVQLQNMARILSPVSADLANVRDYDHLRQHLRLCVHAPKPYKFLCADLSQIEARIVAWFAGCKWRMEAFANNEDIYSRSAERMFNLPHVDKTMPERQMGKCAELGLGYGGSIGAIKNIAPDFVRTVGEGKVADIVERWRAANPEICGLWRTLERAMRTAFKQGSCRVQCGGALFFIAFDGKTAVLTLPSGHALYYRGLHESSDGNLAYLDYSNGVHCPRHEKMWGGTLLENITQAFARDVLVHIMYTLRKRNNPDWYCIGTVHDEIWYLVRDGKDSDLDVLLNAMSSPISWATGLVTKGDGFVDSRYVK